MVDTIICPKCKYEIEVTEVLSAQLRMELRKEFEADVRAKEAAIEVREQEVVRAKAGGRGKRTQKAGGRRKRRRKRDGFDFAAEQQGASLIGLSLNELGDALKTSFKLKANPFKKPQTADEWEPCLAEKRSAVEARARQLADAEAEINARVYKLCAKSQ